MVPTIASLIEKYGLQTDHVSMDDSSSLFAYSEALREILSPLQALEQTIKDEVLRSEASAWTNLSVSYGMLQRVAVAVPALAKDLIGLRSWFRRKHAGSGAATKAPEP